MSIKVHAESLRGSIWILAFSVLAVSFASAAEQRPIPDASELEAARRLVQEKYAPHYTRKNSKDRARLAREFFSLAEEAGTSDALRFVLFEEARKLAIEGRDAETCRRAIAGLGQSFRVDTLPLEARAAMDLAKSLDAKVLVAWTLELVDALPDRHGFGSLDVQAAFKALETLEKLLKRASRATKSEWHRTSLKSRATRLKSLLSEEHRVTKAARALPSNLEDPTANEVLGRFQCLRLGDWRGGLSRWALSTDERQGTLVRADLDRPEAAVACEELGDAWWEASENEKGLERDGCEQRALYWYQRASAGLRELERFDIDKKALRARSVYLSDLSELDAVVGFGTFQKGGKQDFYRKSDAEPVVRVEGLTASKSLALHAVSRGNAYVRYSLHGKFKRLTTFVAINDSARASKQTSPISFQVIGDGKVLWDSKNLRGSGVYKKCDVRVKGVDELQLNVTCPGKFDYLHAVWLDPLVTK